MNERTNASRCSMTNGTRDTVHPLAGQIERKSISCLSSKSWRKTRVRAPESVSEFSLAQVPVASAARGEGARGVLLGSSADSARHPHARCLSSECGQVPLNSRLFRSAVLAVSRPPDSEPRGLSVLTNCLSPCRRRRRSCVTALAEFVTKPKTVLRTSQEVQEMRTRAHQTFQVRRRDRVCLRFYFHSCLHAFIHSFIHSSIRSYFQLPLGAACDTNSNQGLKMRSQTDFNMWIG